MLEFQQRKGKGMGTDFSEWAQHEEICIVCQFLPEGIHYRKIFKITRADVSPTLSPAISGLLKDRMSLVARVSGIEALKRLNNTDLSFLRLTWLPILPLF